MTFAPLEGWRKVKVTDHHAAVDYAQVLKELVVRVVLQRQCSQLDSGQPTFGPPEQGMHVGPGKVEVVVLEEGADVLFIQPEICIPDLTQLAPGPPTLDRQNGIHTSPDHDVHRLGESLDEGGQAGKSGGRDDVQIVEDEPRWLGPQRPIR